MNGQRLTGFCLIALEAALLAMMSRAPLVPGVAALIALAGLIRPLRLPLTFDRRVMGGLIIGVAFAVRWRFFRDLPRDAMILNQGIGPAFAEYLLILQAAMFHLVSPNPALRSTGAPRLPYTLPAYGVVTLACAGDFIVPRIERQGYQAGVLVFMALAAAYLALSGRTVRPPRIERGRAAIAGAVLAVSAVLAWGSGSLLVEHRYELDQLLLAPFAPDIGLQSTGFSGGGQLGSIRHAKSLNEKRAALRVFADAPPEYLRGRAFTRFDGVRWESLDEPREARRTGAGTVAVGPVAWDGKLFRLGEGDEPWLRYEVWPASSYPVAFTPPGTAVLATVADRVRVGAGGTAEAAGLDRYAAFVPGQGPEPSPLSEEERQACLALPPDLDLRIREIAERVFEGCRTPAQKMDAAARYFHTNYHYNLGIEVPSGQSPLTYFFVDKPAAHCEYFATGATVLLRLGGVPARYVTGFVAAERNEAGGYWLARNRDAHAWAEAYDEGAGWQLVEATPAVGVPQPQAASGASEWWDNLRFRLQQLRAGGLRILLAWLGRGVAKSLWVILPVLLLAGAWTVWRRRKGRKKQPTEPVDPALEALLRLRIDVDKLLAKRGIRREASETVQRFAGRLADVEPADPFLQSAADWYRLYTAVRYGPVEDTSVRERLFRCARELRQARPTAKIGL